MPDTLTPLEAAAVGVEAARLSVRDDVLELTVALTIDVSRPADARAAPPAA